MIKVTDKSQCCGCSSCAQKCPNHCITMQPDQEGFFYPNIDINACIDCGLCESVCPILSSKKEHNPIAVFAAKNTNETIREESSSGGIFTMLAEEIIRLNGVVFGARWNKDWNVEHDYTDNIEGLKYFRSSKYVQSNINSSFKKVAEFLELGRIVLFCGTPCQIAGLKTFIGKDYSNLFTVECVCHGVPSPGLWQKYLSEVSTNKAVIGVNHRDKCTGWCNYSVVLKFADGKEISQVHDNNHWMRAFIKNLSLRPSCYSCKFKCNTSFADITLGDLWGEQHLLPEHSEDKGITLVVSHTFNFENIFKAITAIKDIQIEDAIRYNPALKYSSPTNEHRNKFFTMLGRGESFISVVSALTKDSLLLRMKVFVRKHI